jgi:hypothetical protein
MILLPLLEELKRQGIKYRAFYIHNMIAIYDTTPAQIEGLAVFRVDP